MGDLTLASVRELMRTIECPPVYPFAFEFAGMKVIEAPEHPVLQLSADFRWCGDEFRRDMNRWLLSVFGARSIVPSGKAYIMLGHSVVMRREDVVKVTNLT